MTLSKFSVLTFIVVYYILIGCNQSTKPIEEIKKKDSDIISASSDTLKDAKKIVTSSTYSKKEIVITNAVYNLKEVKDWQKYLEKETKGKRHLLIWIADTPKMTEPFYLVQVGEDNGDFIVPHFNFFVYPDAKRILYLDTVNDDTLTLKQWRKTNGM